MSLLRLSRISLAVGLLSLVVLLASSVSFLLRLQTEQGELARLFDIQKAAGVISVGADSIALSGADPVLYAAFIDSARRLQVDLQAIATEFSDANNAVTAIDMILADLDKLLLRNGGDYQGQLGTENNGHFEYFVQSNVASHGIALDAAIGEALKLRQQQVMNNAFQIAASFALVAFLFLFVAVASFALIYRRIGGPLRAFAQTIAAVDQGKTDALAPDSAQDEIGDVARAFNALLIRRRAAEAELERLTSILQIAGETARFGGWRYDATRHEVEWSDETAVIHGEQPGTRPTLEEGLNYYIEQDRPRIAKVFGACVEQGTPFDELFRIRNAQGEVIWIRSTGRPVYSSDGIILGAQGAFQDVSDLVEARTEVALRDAELQDVINSIGDAFLLIDRDWRFRYINQTGLDLIGCTGRNILGLKIWDEFPEAKGTQFESQYQTVLETGQSRSFVEYFPPLGKWFQISAHATRDGLAVYFRDHTAEYEREAQLRLLQTATDRINDIILITEADSQSGPDHPRILYVNAAFEKRTGFSRMEALDATPRILQGPDTQREELDRISAALSVNEGVRAEVINYTRSGEPYWVELDISPVKDDTGQPTHFISVQRDITERKEIEHQLREAQKMEAVGHLTGGIAHDFNNLLTVILGNAELLSEELTDPKLRKMAEVSVSAAERGAQLTGRLLAFARRRPLDPKPTEVNGLIEAIQPLIRRTLPENIEIDVVLDPNICIVEIDAGELDTALLNLVVNARDAMPNGGKLIIETSRVVLDAAYADRHLDVNPGEHVMICVSDTGKGMDPETRRRAFEPFFTTKDVGMGSGLGLSMVFGFTKQSGGHIKIYSELGEGSSVKLYFPRLRNQRKTSFQNVVEGSPRGGTEHILIAEDDDLVREHLRNQLISLGYQVSVSMSGPEALDILNAHESIDLLLTDIIMPGGMNGRELAEIAQSTRPSLRVLFTSGYTENAIVHQGRLDPGVVLLSKPYTRMELATKVRRVLD